MSEIIKCEGAYVIWRWGDREIENPGLLRQQLMDITSQGFLGVIGELRATRYDLLDRQVIRTITQVSQWAKRRQITFWFNGDPRLASRQMIAKTSECIQYLILHPKSKVTQSSVEPGIGKIQDNRFILKYQIPMRKQTHSIPEIALNYEPVLLEKTFIFQLENKQIVRETVRDITPSVHFYINMARQYVEVYGQVQVPEDGLWYAMAFPKYNINVQDYTSRKNNDLMHQYIESLFDEGAYLDGLYWQDPGYTIDAFEIPVSDNIYNIFKLEIGYDLRDKLFALALPVDDGLHHQVRHDYCRFLNETIFDAGTDLKSSAHSFLGQIDFGISYNMASKGECLSKSNHPGTISPWMERSLSTVGMGHLGSINNPDSELDHLLPQLNAIKSMALFSQSQEAFASLWLDNATWENMEYMADLLALYSIRWCAESYGYSGYIGETKCDVPNFPEDKSWPLFSKLNKKIHEIYKITGFILPAANIAMIYPVETLWSQEYEEAKEQIKVLSQFLLQCAFQGLQVDIISPNQLKDGKLIDNQFLIRQRYYRCILYPFSGVLSEDVLPVLKLFKDKKFPFYFAENHAFVLSNGKKISKAMIENFSCIKLDVDTLKNEIEFPTFKFPENCLVSVIQVHDGELFLFAPRSHRQTFSGLVQYGDLRFKIQSTDRLTIYSHWSGENVKRML